MEQERLKRITLRQQKNGTYKPPKPIPSEISPTEMLMEQITQEIKERTEYIDDLKANGENQNKEIIKTVTGEISERMAKLRSLEKEL